MVISQHLKVKKTSVNCLKMIFSVVSEKRCHLAPIKCSNLAEYHVLYVTKRTP